MKKLAVFGCSWTYGVPGVGEKRNKLYDCWPIRFALQNEDYQVYNFARGGTCVNWSIARLLQFLQTPLSEDCKIVFQVTQPYRFTSNVDVCTQGNYNFLQYENYFVDRGTDPVTHMPGNIALRKSPEAKLYRSMIKHYPDTYSFIEHEAQIAYLKNICDFVYRHNSINYKILPNLQNKHTKIFGVREKLTKVKWKEYVADAGDHFGPVGLEWIANIVKENIND